MNATELPRFGDRQTRLLFDRERPYHIGRPALPLVLEAQGPEDLVGLKNLLRHGSERITTALYEYGAILLRGFPVRSERDFEEVLLSIRGLRPMTNYFMAEEGRVPVEGTRYVFYSNKYYITGGSFRLGGFHSENYYSADVPSVQSFWCKQAPWLGGETGLVHMSRAYPQLQPSLRAKLESEPCCARQWTLASVAEYYRVSEDRVEEFARAVGFPIVVADGRKYVLLYKPNVYKHPHTAELSLQVNLSVELSSLDSAMRRLFAPYYRGGKWFLHRLAWKYPAVEQLLTTIQHLPKVVSYPKFVWSEHLKPKLVRANSRKQPLGRPPPAVRLGDKLAPDEIHALAEAMCNHSSIFSWKVGDVLLFDNSQVLHAGMPGLGSRQIRVILANPIPMKHPVTSGVMETCLDSESYESVETRIQLFRSGERAAAPSPQNGCS